MSTRTVRIRLTPMTLIRVLVHTYGRQSFKGMIVYRQQCVLDL